ncbi:FkbM family methyltransferase [Pseudoduganella namucuonensis]|uniref:Methyltransferase, FkbM family n=1 Tax=Pseudoduganella namucuonensis TaxID=1035707 RepID=A0A1I7M4X9_9BURK|nr:FkbM family methyltransferase [Pseudoduganella namucuonensis]SFV17004.1 methyltransferase, FkbM family [Pseudoduganella namucuonensis]
MDMMDYLRFKKIVRTAQTYFPYLSEIKPWVQNMVCRILRKPFESDFRALRLFPEGQTYVDVGANRGQSITAIRMMARKGKIISFEANPILARKLSDRYSNSHDVVVNSFGLGADEGEFTLHVPRYRKYIFDGLGSIDRSEAISWLSEKTLYGFDPNKLSLLSLPCILKTLDSLNISPFFIKLDIQGFEKSALDGARKTLTEHTPVLLMETPNEDLCEYLRGLGYSSYFYRNGVFFHGNDYKLNLFFMTPDKIALLRGNFSGAMV